MNPLLTIAVRAARDSADALAHQSDRLDRVKIIEDAEDGFLCSADLESDKTLLYHIQKAYPDHNIISRASGEYAGKEGEPTWLVDPLLGNRNFAAGYPRFGVSIAILTRNVIEHAAVIAPLLGDEFIASRGGGAQWKTRRIRVGAKSALPGALIALDSQGMDERLFIDMQQALMRAEASPRISGCGPLDMLDAACGRVKGGWCRQQHATSIAASNLILQEAGGFIGAENGNPRLENQAEILYGEAELFKLLVKMRMRLNA